MGRLFWKFFLFIWLGQLAAIAGTGALFWVERQQFAERMAKMDVEHIRPDRPMPSPPPPPPQLSGAEGFAASHSPPPPKPPKGGPDSFPVLPLAVGLIASLACAFGLAWYFAKPIRNLRQACDAVADGNLEQRVAPAMGRRRDELADLGRDFDHMTGRLQALMNGQKRLLHDVSHEMRSPLARLQAAIGLARQQPARMEDSLQRIERESERMNLLVGELLTLSRLDAGVIGEMERVDTADLLAGIVDDARFEGGLRGVIVEYTPGVMPEVQANAEWLHRAVENVVRNALRYSPQGGVLNIHAGQVGCVFRIGVADEGPGVEESELEAIFKPFHRADSPVSSDGYGLGLAIAQRIIAAVNGKIWAKRGKPSGLVVSIELPVC